MPTTARRRVFVPQAIRLFKRQDYANKELVIVDDGLESIEEIVPVDDPHIRYIRLTGERTLGMKRNFCVEAARGNLIMHWDDDDWASTRRISYQTDALLSADAEICGVRQMIFYELATARTWLYEYPEDQRPWLAGNSLLYTREFWQRSPFPDIQVASDTRFVWSQPMDRHVALTDYSFYVAMIHPDNTSPKNYQGSYWSPWHGQIKKIMGADYAFYKSFLAGEEKQADAESVDEQQQSSHQSEIKLGHVHQLITPLSHVDDKERCNSLIAGPHHRPSLRIGYVLTNFSPLSESFIRREILALCDRGQRVFVYANHVHYESQVTEPTHPNLLVREVQFISNPSALSQAALEDGIEHLHASLMSAAHRAAYLAAQTLQIPFTLMAYSGLDIFTGRDPELYRAASLDTHCVRIIVEDDFMSDWMKEHYQVAPDKLAIVPNSFDLDLYRLREERESRSRIVILSIARFVEKKGLIYLINAFNQLSEARENAELWLVGYGPEENSLRQAASGNERIKFFGAMSEEETRKVYAGADIFALPCIQTATGDGDGVPTTLLEAMAFELPVVGTNLLSTPCYVRDGEEGFLVPPRDVVSLAGALERLCADQKLREEMGRLGRERVSRICDIKKNVLSLEEIFMKGRSANWHDLEIFDRETPVPTHLKQQLSRQLQTQTALASICITTYNRAELVKTCIDSALRQTYTNVEVIVVDDGSTDETRRTLEAYGQSIRVAYNEQNRGIAFSKNRALRLTSEESRYVCILDSDDYYHPRFLERCVEFLETNPRTGLVYTDDIMVDLAGRELRQQPAVEPWDVENWLRTRNLRGDTWLARRELVLSTNLRDSATEPDVDYDLFYQLLEMTSFAHLPEFLVFIRQHAGRTTTANAHALARAHAANLVKYGYSPEYAYLRAHYNPEWIPAIEEGIALGHQLRTEASKEKGKR